jgi:hypothetical protein
MFILRDVPDAPSGTIPPYDFPADAKKSIDKTLSSIRAKFCLFDDAAMRSSWDNWAAKWAPRGDTALEYLQQLKEEKQAYHIPCKTFILRRAAVIQDIQWDPEMVRNREMTVDFAWPEVIALAMPSVITDFNPHPPAPRAYSSHDVALQAGVQVFHDAARPFYEAQLDTCTVVVITAKLRRKLSYSGEELPVTGRKSTLLKRLKEADTHFATVLLRPLSHVDQVFVDGRVHRALPTEEAKNDVIQCIGTLEVKLGVLRQLGRGSPLQSDFMDVAVSLAAQRDDRICRSHSDVNRDTQYYQARAKSLFYGRDILDALDADIHIDQMDVLLSGADFVGTHHIYLMRKVDNPGNPACPIWSLVVISIVEKSIYLVDTTRATPPAVLVSLANTLHPLLSRKLGDAYGQPWVCRSYPAQMHNPLQNPADSGLYISLSLYYIIHDTPICLEETNNAVLRDSLAHWILCGRLPL